MSRRRAYPNPIIGLDVVLEKYFSDKDRNWFMNIEYDVKQRFVLTYTSRNVVCHPKYQTQRDGVFFHITFTQSDVTNSPGVRLRINPIDLHEGCEKYIRVGRKWFNEIDKSNFPALKGMTNFNTQLSWKKMKSGNGYAISGYYNKVHKNLSKEAILEKFFKSCDELDGILKGQGYSTTLWPTLSYFKAQEENPYWN
jgi:hypothetical protein